MSYNTEKIIVKNDDTGKEEDVNSSIPLLPTTWVSPVESKTYFLPKTNSRLWLTL